MAGPFKMKAGKGGPMLKNFGISPVKQNATFEKTKNSSEKNNNKITQGQGGYSYKIDYRKGEGNLGNGTSDMVYRPPHIYSSKDGGKFNKVKTDSDAYKAIMKKHYSKKLKNMPAPPNPNKAGFKDAKLF
jgi:hypothetical protein